MIPKDGQPNPEMPSQRGHSRSQMATTAPHDSQAATRDTLGEEDICPFPTGKPADPAMGHLTSALAILLV